MGMGREGWRQNYEGIGKHEDGRGTNEFDGGEKIRRRSKVREEYRRARKRGGG